VGAPFGVLVKRMCAYHRPAGCDSSDTALQEQRPWGRFRKEISRASVCWQRDESLERDKHRLTKLLTVRKHAYTPWHLEHWLPRCVEARIANSTIRMAQNDLSNGVLNRNFHLGSPRSTSLGLTDYSQVDLLGSRYKFVNLDAEKSPGLPNWCAGFVRRLGVQIRQFWNIQQLRLK